MKKVATFASIAVFFALLLPGASVAADSSQCQAYNPQLCPVVTTVPTTPTSTLPFTGLDVALLVAGGLLLVGAGLVVRVASRRLQD
jgi:hypothetical protein